MGSKRTRNKTTAVPDHRSGSHRVTFVEESPINLYRAIRGDSRAPRKQKMRKLEDVFIDCEQSPSSIPCTQNSNVSSYSEESSPCSEEKRAKNLQNVISQEKKKLHSGTFQAHLDNLWRSFPEWKKNSITHFDSLWFFYYITYDDYKEKVMNWIKKKDIFSKNYVIVPIVLWDHWSVLIFCHFGESPDSKTRTPCMLLLDSLQEANPKRLEPGIRKFVSDIYRAEGKTTDKKVLSKMPLLVPKVPQQKNFECGFCVLYYIYLFVTSAPDDFSVYEGYPYFMKEDWFTQEKFDFFCKSLDSSSEWCCLA